MAPVRMVHHSIVVPSWRNRASASWGRVRAAMSKPGPPRYPIPLLLPCEILLIICEMLPPEACACLINCCSYMRGLYCEDGTFATEQLWVALLRRTFPQRTFPPPRQTKRSTRRWLAPRANAKRETVPRRPR